MLQAAAAILLLPLLAFVVIVFLTWRAKVLSSFIAVGCIGIAMRCSSPTARAGQSPRTPARQTAFIRMRDGVRLATDYYVPEGNGPFPVILLRTPYDKNGGTGIGADGAKRGYAIVIQDFQGAKGPYALSTIFQDIGGWKLAGYYVRPEAAVGHDGLWFLQRARDYKTKNQTHNAWFYYVKSWDLLAPVTFMDTRLLSKITQESSGIQPKDIPRGSPVNYSANGKSYNITEITVYPCDNTFDLSIKYSVPSTADFQATMADARNLANAYVSQYPELKDAFDNVWAHAVDPNGGDVPAVINLKPAGK